jgi:hypothetical protein
MNIKFLLIALITLMSLQNNYAQCPNGNAEQGTLNLWQGASGTADNVINNFTSNFGECDAIKIINPPILQETTINGSDIYGNFSSPREGNYAFRLGDNIANKRKHSMFYRIKITPTNAHLKFRYATVLNTYDHKIEDQASFRCFMNLTKQTLLYPHLPAFISHTTFDSLDKKLFNRTFIGFSADTIDTRLTLSPQGAYGGKVLYKNWECVEYDLTEFVGQDALIFFMTTDCSYGGHFAYAYIDGLCENYPTFANFTLNTFKTCNNGSDFILNTFKTCNNGSDFILNGTNSENETKYKIEITESNNATGTSLTSNVIASPFFDTEAGKVDLKKLYPSLNGIWKCNTYYKLRFTVANGCSTNSKDTMFLYTCPVANAGRDTSLCCNYDGPCFNLGVASGGVTPPNSYNWSSSPGNYSNSTAQICVNPNVSTAYILNVTDFNGCENTDTVSISYLGNIIINIS